MIDWLKRNISKIKNVLYVILLILGGGTAGYVGSVYQFSSQVNSVETTNWYMINSSYKFSELGYPIPAGEKLRYFNVFYMESADQPTENEILEKAEELGILKDGFSVHSITELEDDYREFTEPELPEAESDEIESDEIESE